MKRLFCGIILLCCVSNLYATILFTEDWEDGIDTNKWRLWGQPLPYLVSSGSMGDSLCPNGDTMYQSGVVTVSSFLLQGGTTFTYYSKLQASGYTQNLVFSLTQLPLSKFQEVNPEPGQWSPEGLPQISQNPETVTAWGKKTTYQTLNNTNDQNVTQSETPGVWFKFSIEFLDDGTFNYYRNDELVITSLPGEASDYMNEQVRIVLHGRSVGTNQVFDNISVIYTEPIVIPEPASIMLLILPLSFYASLWRHKRKQ